MKTAAVSLAPSTILRVGKHPLALAFWDCFSFFSQAILARDCYQFHLATFQAVEQYLTTEISVRLPHHALLHSVSMFQCLLVRKREGEGEKGNLVLRKRKHVREGKSELLVLIIVIPGQFGRDESPFLLMGR